MITAPDPRTRPLHIALLSLHTSPMMQPGQGDAGGMNVYVRHLADSLTDLGHRVDLITVWRASEHPDELVPEAEAQWSQIRPGLRLLEVVLPQTVRATKEQMAQHLEAITQTIRETYASTAGSAPDVVHGHYWLSAVVALELAQAWQVPAVNTFHTTALAKNQRAGSGETAEPVARVDGESTAIRDSSAVITNTTSEAHDLQRLYGASPSAVQVIPPGVDISIFHPDDDAPPVPDTPTEERAFVIGFAGRLQALKGPQVLVEALGLIHAEHPDTATQAWIAGVGSPDFTADLRARIADAGLTDSVELMGSIPVTELAARFRSSDVVVVPSSSETFGLVALEAQACGTPVVATDVDGLQHAVEDGVTGWLLPDRSPRTWAQALVEIAADPLERQRRAVAAANRAQKFSWEATASAHVNLYRGVGAGGF